MSFDYYAYHREQDLANEIEQLVKIDAEERKEKDKQRKKELQAEIRKKANDIIKNSPAAPHLARLWLKAVGSAADLHIQDAWLDNTLKQQKQNPASVYYELLGEKGLKLIPALPDIAHLPPYSFALHIPITLTSPYLSRDDELFYIIENPVRKERVFGVPYVAASGWKGALRAALWQQLGKEGFEQSDSIKRLFGKAPESSGEHDEGQGGSLYLYPTFFNCTPSLEIINPHDRETGVGKNPILMECVPTGAQGSLTLLYVPLAVPAQPAAVAADLRLLVDGVVAMLTIYGFGAKTSSGYGTAELEGKGTLALHASLPEAAAEPASAEETPPAPDHQKARYLDAADNLKAEFRRADGSLISEAEYQAAIEDKKKKYGRQDKQLYDKAKKWWDREGRAAWEQRTAELEQAPVPPEAPEPAAPDPTHTATFATAEELCQLAERIAAAPEGQSQ